MYRMKDIDKEIIEISIGKEAIKDYYERKKIDTELFTATPLKPKGSLFKKDKTPSLEVDINKTLLLKGLNLKAFLESIEKEYIAEALDIDRDQKGAGERLGYSQQKISQKVKKYNL
jgi:transcriptional regulator with PAS, ATPase and Fis domain